MSSRKPREAARSNPSSAAARTVDRTPPVAPSSILMRLGWPGVLFLITFLAYLPALRAGFIWDDDAYVTANPAITSLSGLRTAWTDIAIGKLLFHSADAIRGQHLCGTPQYYPLVFTTFWMQHAIHGLAPMGYHLVNILLHATSAILLWIVLRRLNVPGAWLAAGLFALHPVHVESVAWVTERKNVLSGTFYLASMLCYLRSANLFPEEAHGGPETPVRSARWLYALALLLFVLALLSKTVTASLPAAILLIIWWQRGMIRRAHLLPLIPFFLIALPFSRITSQLEATHVGAFGPEWAMSPFDRVLIAGRAAWFYAAKLTLPYPLTFVYRRWSIDEYAVSQYLFPLAAIALISLLWLLRKRIGRGPLVAVLFFGGTVLPALGFVNVYPMRYSFVADHFQYLASIGLLVLAAGALATKLPAPVARGAGIAWLVILGLLTARQTLIYHDLETLWRDTIAKNPSAWIAHNNLGLVLEEKGDTDGALASYEAALNLRPEYPEALSNKANLLVGEKRTDEAISLYEEALRLRPDFPEAHHNLGAVLLSKGDRRGVEHYRRMFASKPDFPLSVADAVLLARAGEWADIVRKWGDKLRFSKDSANLRYELGGRFADAGLVPEAIAQYQEALKRDPAMGSAHNEIGSLLATSGKVSEAMSHFEQAVRLSPEFAPAYYNLAQARTLQNQPAAAIETLRQLVARHPRDADAHAALGDALARQGDSAAARQAYEEALRLNTNHETARRALDR